MDNRQNDMPGSGVGAMNGTIWPHAAVSSAPTPTGEMHLDPGMHNGMHDGNGVFMDGLGAVPYGLEDINWENSLLMPVCPRRGPNCSRSPVLISFVDLANRDSEVSVNSNSAEASYIHNSVAVSCECVTYTTRNMPALI